MCTSTTKGDKLSPLYPFHLLCLHPFISLRALVTQRTVILTPSFTASVCLFSHVMFLFSCLSTPSTYFSVPWLLVYKTLKTFHDSWHRHVWFWSRTVLPRSSFRWNLSSWHETDLKKTLRRTNSETWRQKHFKTSAHCLLSTIADHGYFSLTVMLPFKTIKLTALFVRVYSNLNALLCYHTLTR